MRLPIVVFCGSSLVLLRNVCDCDTRFVLGCSMHGLQSERFQFAKKVIKQHWRRNVIKWWGQLNFESIFRAYHSSEDN